MAVIRAASCDALVLDACRRLRGIDLHPAYGIVLFSLLHGAIMAVFAHFALFHSDQGSAGALVC